MADVGSVSDCSALILHAVQHLSSHSTNCSADFLFCVFGLDRRRKRILTDGQQARLEDMAAELDEQYELTELLPAKYGNIILRPIDFDAGLQELMEDLAVQREGIART